MKNIKKDGSRSREPSKYYKIEAQKPQHAKTFVVKHVVKPVFEAIWGKKIADVFEAV